MLKKPSLYDDFKDARREVNNNSSTQKDKTPGYKKGYSSYNPYEVFSKKYMDFENTVDTFNARDLMFYFRETARKAGIKYVIPSMQKDTSLFKRMLNDYTPAEICLMIRFIFESDQVYFVKKSTTPGIFTTRWLNTIYNDAQLWDAGEDYLPCRKKPARKLVREYTEDNIKPGVGKWV